MWISCRYSSGRNNHLWSCCIKCKSACAAVSFIKSTCAAVSFHESACAAASFINVTCAPRQVKVGRATLELEVTFQFAKAYPHIIACCHYCVSHAPPSVTSRLHATSTIVNPSRLSMGCATALQPGQNFHKSHANDDLLGLFIGLNFLAP